MSSKEWLDLLDNYVFAVQRGDMNAQEAFEKLSLQRTTFLSEQLLEAFKVEQATAVIDPKKIN